MEKRSVQRVFVLDKNKQPLMPCHPARARELLKKGKAAVFRYHPFTIILKDREGGDTQPIQVKIDPGSKYTGVALVADFKRGKKVIWASVIYHRGHVIKKNLDTRRGVRRFRRNRKTRYRKPRFLNRKRKEGWLPPSLISRAENILTWVKRIRRFSPVTSISMELVRFDTQKLQNPEIKGVEYQRGTLYGYEVKEYLLEKWGRKCAYCGKENVPLEIEHIVPKSKGGSDRISNLTLACHECNQKKNNQSIDEFLANNPKKLNQIKARAKGPLKDVASVNATRWYLFNQLKKEGLPIEVGTGGQTKYNREMQNYSKKHWIDAACVGESGYNVQLEPDMQVLEITAMGHGMRRICFVDKYGFPKSYRPKERTYMGYKTGDIVLANVPKGKNKGIHIGRIAIRHRPSFLLNGVGDVHPKYLTLLQKNDGYGYQIS
ncbi:HNH endonuclease [Petrotoga sp. HWH.PT.55.6.1]|jgi:5-methylcytosine-specific restriction endonuclease McrA|uniref:RNA-guided endonuclease IscB n=1 Tax=unclassified Petrotoga TaxID=2620614 RepID=UPI000CA02A05|nr:MULTISPECIES: RNA-guided endonuclease IscB [unclassified Petrotoga]PNR88598.1 endonuclease [Petrotoga sp. 9T1HF07.CasAA.8.2]PNR92630.1 endonuclease [Petrotoga sp. HWHPT.55.6.3]RPD36550.1 HNH endonuclease [Petrotoga sp. HWH.PT.55.6.1]